MYIQNVNNNEYTILSTLSGEQQAYAGSLVSVDIANITLTGFHLDTDNQNNNYLNVIVAGNGTTVLKVYYNREIYTITFDTNKGSGSTTPNVDQGSTLNPELRYDAQYTFPIVTRDGYVLKGWNTSANGQGTTVSATDLVKKALIIYAIWEANR